MLFLNLDCGRTVSVGNFDYSRTYAGLLEGRPDAELNRRIIKQAISDRTSTWGKRAVHLIPPTVDASDPDHPMLPPVLLRVWLTCYEPIDGAFMASECVIVWFTEECHDQPMSETIFQAVRGVSWDKVATDFDW